MLSVYIYLNIWIKNIMKHEQSNYVIINLFVIIKNIGGKAFHDKYVNFIYIVEQLKNSIGISFCYIFLGLNFGRKRIFHKGFILLLRETRRRNVFWWGRSRVISISRFESLRRKRQSLLVLFSSGCCQRGDVPVRVNLHRSLLFFLRATYRMQGRPRIKARKSRN